jgi:hypothetical protein
LLESLLEPDDAVSVEPLLEVSLEPQELEVSVDVVAVEVLEVSVVEVPVVEVSVLEVSVLEVSVGDVVPVEVLELVPAPYDVLTLTPVAVPEVPEVLVSLDESWLLDDIPVPVVEPPVTTTPLDCT